MFADACEKAQHYTNPLVLSHRAPSGECGSGIGTFVVVNNEGWCLTAAHILEQRQALAKAKAAYVALMPEKEKIEADGGLSAKVKRKRLNRLLKGKELLLDHSDWWGRDGVSVAEAHSLHVAVDLAVVRLAPWDPSWVAEYPVIKDPSKPLRSGTSLCRLGFPFHNIVPAFEDGTGFVLPKDAFPFPLFPIEGILTRSVNMAVDGAGPRPFPMKLIETSSPGLMGQSGGPVFDREGTVWGIQSRTTHHALGFAPKVKSEDGRPDRTEHQFLNVGWAVHAETIVGFLDDLGVDYEMSSY